jgi:hypothetical protein
MRTENWTEAESALRSHILVVLSTTYTVHSVDRHTQLDNAS